MDVFTASPEERYCATSAPMQVARLCAKLTQAANDTMCKSERHRSSANLPKSQFKWDSSSFNPLFAWSSFAKKSLNLVDE